MKVVGTAILKQCALRHADARRRLKGWLEDATRATWTSPADIRERYASATIISGNCVKFDIRGGNYRLVACVNFELSIVQILFVDTHEKYDRIDVAGLCREGANYVYQTNQD